MCFASRVNPFRGIFKKNYLQNIIKRNFLNNKKIIWRLNMANIRYCSTFFRFLVLGIFFSCLTTISLVPVYAAYPEKSVSLVSPFQPGGASDVLARVIVKPLSDALGQSVIIENKPGAGGNIGINYVARSKPDGHTLLITTSVLVINPSLYKNAGFDPFKDFLPISDCGASPNVILTKANSGINSFNEMITIAKNQPDTLNYAHAGIGVSPHLGMELFKSRAKINITPIPYPGGGPAIQAVLGGSTQIGSINILGLMPHIKSGALIPLAQTGRERSSEIPNVPTLTELGYPNTEAETFVAILAPAGTPSAIIERLSKEINTILQTPEVSERLKNYGFRVLAGGPDVLRGRIQREVPMWKDVIEKAKVAVD
jgi:tripartite-type tricarboxylate transporter receptor subunit TctC